MSSNSPISSAATISNPISPHNSMVPQLYGIKAVAHRASVNDLGVQSIHTRIPAVLILFGFLVEALNVTLTKQKANYSDDCTDYWHSGAVLSERISDGIARVNIELSEPGEYYVCFQRRSNEVNHQNESKEFKGWIHQGSNYHVTLRVTERLMPIPLQISLIILCLVLSGTFSGLNLGLMSLDLNEIQVIIRCGTDLEKQYAKIIAPIRKKGNYLLCSILFGNVLVNSTLTILMDDLTSGLVAVVVSTLSIVVFGEIVPQAICSRHGLAVGAKTIYLTKLFMLLTFPLSLFISKILDRVLGEEIGHVYDRERLMEYIRITKTYNQLEDEEMNIISGALGLKTKTAEDVMTRIDDAFMLPITAILDFKTVSEISKKGYSRIPVYDSYPANIVAILHSKDLTFIDPDHKKPLRTIIEFYKHPLIYTEADERLHNVLNCFKSGRSHLAFVRKLFDTDDEDPYYEIIGLLTLEDVIEEILQMEINDETDILSDNRRKIKRKEAQIRQDFSDFVRIGESETSTQAVSPQMALATFQFLSTAVEPFHRKFIAENILRLLIGQKIYHSVEISELEERTYLTACSLSSFNATACLNENESKLLYKCGKPADYFIMILEGRVRVIVGAERLSYEAGPFTFFGVSVLRPPALATKMLLGGNAITNNSTTALNNLNSLNQGDMISSGPPSIETIPLLECRSMQTVSRSRPSSPEITPPNRSSSTNSDLCSRVQFDGCGGSKVFVPDFTVKPVEKTLYMKIPRKVYLAAFRASLIDRKDELLEHDLENLEMLSREEVDGVLYRRLANASQTIESTLQNSKMNKSSSDLIKEKRFSIADILPKLITQPEAASGTMANAQPNSPPITSQVQQAPVANVANVANVVSQQRRSSIINEQRRENNKQPPQSSKAIRKFIKQQGVAPNLTEANNLTNLTAINNNSYAAVNNNLTSAPITNIITNPQLENVIVDGGNSNESVKTKF